tara:strand:+ start:254 stop:895 length:642 start_codon:yes stop_codon:yes gene_type:complete
MKTKTIKKILILLILGFSLNLSSQENNDNEKIRLTILVHDVNNNPIPGAIILFDDVKQKRLTNSAGYFKIKLDKTPKIIAAFSPSIGLKKVKYTNVDNITIKITSEVNKSEITKEDINTKEDNPIQYRNIYDYLRGKVSGVNVGAGNVITIRGYNSVNGSTTPMFILNDNQVEESIFSNIVPTDIKSIQVFKSTDSAIYGSRGANGVIKVTTF